MQLKVKIKTHPGVQARIHKETGFCRGYIYTVCNGRSYNETIIDLAIKYNREYINRIKDQKKEIEQLEQLQ